MPVQAAPGNNNAAGLSTLTPQPDFDGIAYPRIIHAASGIDYQDGKPFVDLRFPDVVTPAEWLDVLGKFGLGSAKTALCTLRIPGVDKVTYSNYNGRAVRPEYGQDLTFEYCFYKTPHILVKRLVAI